VGEKALANAEGDTRVLILHFCMAPSDGSFCERVLLVFLCWRVGLSDLAARGLDFGPDAGLVQEAALQSAKAPTNGEKEIPWCATAKAVDLRFRKLNLEEAFFRSFWSVARLIEKAPHRMHHSVHKIRVELTSRADWRAKTA